ncbi:glycerol dehydrogenase [Nocardiopsis kunsanensis]|uniref:Glycerol dehydrogenase n=1 Tax=Nocardiopsis kunsanensis TaxID=141693 RepID=A0A918XES6_9ACTN|nr:glycerol dehydrogenase [Nocardiopsis kunsanensis]GHD28755.1 glycerol dehydrogenase [Nocardiopsis kunsanensis]
MAENTDRTPVSVFASPGRYVQGRGALGRLGTLMEGLGSRRPLVLTDDVVRGLTEQVLTGSFAQADLPLAFERFGGMPTSAEADRVSGVIDEGGHDAVIGLGGGTAIDTAKAAGDNAGVPWVSAATVASTDAPTSALSVVYTESGSFESYRFYSRNPALVVVDTQYVAEAPVRFLSAGVGDALATWIEARAVRRAHSPNMVGGLPTHAGSTLAELSWNLLWRSALPALEAVEKNLVTQDVEAIVEATTLLSGLGFESGGLAAAHAIHDGLTAVDQTHHFTHGEKVNIGSLTQLVLEGAPASEIDPFAEFTARVGLPTTLTEAGLGGADETVLDEVVRAAMAPSETIHNLAFEPTHRDVRDALRAVEGVGRRARERVGLGEPTPEDYT